MSTYALSSSVLPVVQRAGVRIVTRLNPAARHVLGDELMLKRILINLISNAIKFTPPSGRIEVSCAPEADGGLLLAVADTGLGIASSDLPKVLEPFVQAGDALSRHHGGTGLGLPLTKSLVEKHGGGLAIASRLGEGTRVSVTLPARRILAQPGDRPAPRAARAHQKEC